MAEKVSQPKTDVLTTEPCHCPTRVIFMTYVYGFVYVEKKIENWSVTIGRIIRISQQPAVQVCNILPSLLSRKHRDTVLILGRCS